MRALKEETCGEIAFSGVGGDAMQAEGLSSIFSMSDLSIMGLTEVVPHIPKVLKRLRETEKAVLNIGPDALVTIDAQVFAAMLSKRVKKVAPTIARIQYVAPSVWAWKPWRARKAAQIYNHMLTLFPFEPPYFEREGLASTCVGHPLVEKIAALAQGASEDLRAEIGIPSTSPLLLVAPGSRKSEIARLAEPFTAAAAHLADQIEGLKTVVPVAPAVAAEVEAMVAGWPTPLHLVRFEGLSYEEAEARKFAAFGAADAALAASGTVTLEIAAMKTPTVVGYRIPRLTEFILRRMVRVNSVSLTNILSGRTAIPEFLQSDCTGERLSEALLPLLTGGSEADVQREAQAAAITALGTQQLPPSRRAAKTILEQMEKD